MYTSKILLFGEYTILMNSHALAIPYSLYSGEWAYMEDDMGYNPLEAYYSNRNLKEFKTYLKLLIENQKLEYPIDICTFEEDLENGLYFNSNIPKGAGLGSSGALIAAFSDKYAQISTNNVDYLRLKNFLALLESFFHGTSSGIDPIVSYLNKPVIFKGKDIVEAIKFPLNKLLQNFGLFLVNTGLKGNTGKLVKYFKNKCNNNPEYLKILQNQYIPLTNKCIKEITSLNNPDNFFSIIPEITKLQLSLFNEMIPEKFITLINYGLDKHLFYLKLCGSGGGGYFIGFTKSINKTKSYLNENSLEIIPFESE